nr:BTAD domain-containing putative transcriptional regulator [Patulibacter sp. SYSU D01012]
MHGVRRDGVAVPGARSHALLAALALAEGRAVRADRLVASIWGDEPPANAAKALQVVVSRTRAACGADAVASADGGYRLGLDPDAVDALRLRRRTDRAARALDDDPAAAAAAAREAVALGAGVAAPAADEDGPLAALLRDAVADAARARALLARACSRTGDHVEALPALEAAHGADPDDEALLADLLRSEAAVRGPGAALERYEQHRQALRDRLGASPGEPLRRVHRELLALDRPVRAGVRHDATTLLGRDADVRRLKTLLAGSRVVSIVGPGGLGKTRLAHLLAREAEQPVVHVVELVGVTAPDDVVGELGSVLGVRDSVAGRRALTPEQRADVRSRVAQALGRAPTLLVLDNCEHVVDAVAGLVAFLVSQTADLRVLTTSRAPLAIAAERVHLLGALGDDDARRLFRERAVAARPGVRLDDAAVAAVVDRLDGLPLAIELAAARVRAMAVEDVARRLADRFALLRGGDRAAPDRHRTLEAVIGWSWDLLDDPGRRALRRLAVFHDGFTLDAADAVLGGDALPAVQDLVAQSLLTVEESATGIRHRMLETVREFGLLRLREEGEEPDARAAHRAWAVGVATAHGCRLYGPEQFAAIDALAAEDANLADALRAAFADGDVDAAVALVAALAGMWSIRGEHVRVMPLAVPLSEAIADWRPPPALRDAARAAASVTLTNTMIGRDEATPGLRALLVRLADEPPGHPQLAASSRVALRFDPEVPRALPAGLEPLCDDPDPQVARIALQWMAHTRENAGDLEGAVATARRALDLVSADDGPWAAAILRTQLAELSAALGDHAAAGRHARAALPVLARLGARDDEVHMHGLVALEAIADGRLRDAQATMETIEATAPAEAVFGGRAARAVSRAELRLARGLRAEGLAAYREATETVDALTFPGVTPTGLEPWVIFVESAAVAGFAHHAGPEEEAEGRARARTGADRVARLLRRDDPYTDHPVVGAGLFAAGTWWTLREDGPVEGALRLLVLAERFSYNRTVPSMAWAPVAARAEERAPGRLAALRDETAGLEDAALRRAALRAVEALLAAADQTRLA